MGAAPYELALVTTCNGKVMPTTIGNRKLIASLKLFRRFDIKKTPEKYCHVSLKQ